MFIVIEGLDGSGKTTQLKLLSEKLTLKNITNIITRQPSENPIGKMARAFTLGEYPNMSNEAVSMLFAADRIQHYHEEIEIALKNGYVLCDRYYYSNLAYQGTDEAAVKRIISYNQSVMGEKKPDLVIFLNTKPEECINRISKTRANISIYESLSNLKTLQERFLTVFDHLNEAENIKIIETDGLNIQDVHERVWALVTLSCKA